MSEAEATLTEWLAAFRASKASELSDAARAELDLGVRALIDWCSLPEHWPITAASAIHFLTHDLPRSVSVPDSDALVDASIAFLVWAAKTSRVRERKFEYSVRNTGRDAKAAMRDERRWGIGKSMHVHAIHDGVDPTDADALRAHAIGLWHDAAYVDEFLPRVVALGGGRYLYR